MNKQEIRQQIDRFYEKIEQLKADLPHVIWSSNRIPAQLVDVSRNIGDDIIRIEIKGQIRKAAIDIIERNNFEINSITARRSTLIVFIKEWL